VKKKSVVITAFTPEARLKRRIRAHLRKLGFNHGPDGSLVAPPSSKENIRALHLEQRRDGLKAERKFVQSVLPKLETYFANGSEIEPEKIEPRLELIEAGTWQSNLFRLASLSWSVPVSYGFGRRLRYLVWDDNNGKLIGIIALGDPVYNLRVRDDLIGWTAKDRSKRLVGVLDAYVLGAVPPYNMILGGKLVACLIRTKEVRDDFAMKYGDTRGIISKKKKRAQLALITTSSSLGRSSVYNRLKLAERLYLTPIGYTQGWGHFHVPNSLFTDLREYLRKRKHGYWDGHKFGEGPNWRLRTIRAAFDALGVKPDWLKHGIGREVYICEMASNARKFLRGESTKAVYRGLKTVSEVGELARQRWLIPRAISRTEFKDWTREQFKQLVLLKKSRGDTEPQASLKATQQSGNSIGR
jgi:Domain of unknown function (DUF4338)